MTDEGRKTRDDGRQSKRISSVRELKVYRLAFQAAMEIGRKTFESLDEKYEHIFAMLFTMEQKADSFCNVR